MESCSISDSLNSVISDKLSRYNRYFIVYLSLTGLYLSIFLAVSISLRSK